jgi:hypothetical protein
VGLFDKKPTTSPEITQVAELIKRATPDIEWVDGEGGEWAIREGSTLIRIVTESEVLSEGPSVNIIGHVAWGVPESIAMYKTLLNELTPFLARWESFPSEGTGVDLLISRRHLLADLTDEGFKMALADVAGASDAFDERIVEQFGGKTSVAQLGWDD